MIKQMYPFICNNNKTLSYLELNYKRRIVSVLEIEKWGNSISKIQLRHVQSCAALTLIARAQNFDGL